MLLSVQTFCQIGLEGDGGSTGQLGVGGEVEEGEGGEHLNLENSDRALPALPFPIYETLDRDFTYPSLCFPTSVLRGDSVLHL